MSEQAATASTQRSEQLRYVTEHFQDLQGMRLAPFWAYLCVLPIMDIRHRSGTAKMAALPSQSS